MLLHLLLSGITISLAPEAKVRGTEIELGAIATVTGEDPAQVARVRGLRLGYAPAPGYSRLLVGARLQADVARTLPGLTIAVTGAEACRVLPATELVDGRVIEAAARSELLRRFEGRELELALSGTIGDVEVPSGERAVELRALFDASARKSGSLNVPVRVLVDGVLYRTVWTNWQLALWEEASVPVRAIAPGETITLEMLEKKRVASPGVGPDAALPAGLCLGATAARALPAGQPIRELDLLRPLLVQRGDALFLEVRRSGIQARIGALAEQDGRAGDRLRVTVLDTKRTLTATLVSRDLAVIDL